VTFLVRFCVWSGRF